MYLVELFYCYFSMLDLPPDLGNGEKEREGHHRTKIPRIEAKQTNAFSSYAILIVSLNQYSGY